jgi:hypothetical protein
MRRWILAGLFCLVWTASALAADVNGLWRFPEGNQTFIFFQEDSDIKVMCTYRDSGGNVVTWYGKGTISGNVVRYTFRHANTNDEGDNEHVFTVSRDGDRMRGTWGKVGRVMGRWTLEREGP